DPKTTVEIRKRPKDCEIPRFAALFPARSGRKRKPIETPLAFPACYGGLSYRRGRIDVSYCVQNVYQKAASRRDYPLHFETPVSTQCSGATLLGATSQP